jgi:cell division protease FtsH
MSRRDGAASPGSMDLKRFFRGPIFWIAVLIIVILFIGDLVTRSGGFQQEDTYKVVDQIRSDKVTSAVIVGGTDQEIRVTTKSGEKLKAAWVNGQDLELQKLLQQKSDQGKLPEGYNVEISRPSLLGSLISTLLPLASPRPS